MDLLIEALKTFTHGTIRLDKTLIETLGLEYCQGNFWSVKTLKWVRGPTRSVDGALALASELGWRVYSIDCSIPDKTRAIICKSREPSRIQDDCSLSYSSVAGNTIALAICASILAEKLNKEE